MRKTKKRLMGWKHKPISLAGRICLINSVLSSLPLFFLSFFKIPIGVKRKIIKLQHHFL